MNRYIEENKQLSVIYYRRTDLAREQTLCLLFENLQTISITK